MAFDIYYRYSTAVVQSGSVRDLVRELQRKGANSAKGFFIIGLDWPGHISSARKAYNCIDPGRLQNIV